MSIMSDAKDDPVETDRLILERYFAKEDSAPSTAEEECTYARHHEVRPTFAECAFLLRYHHERMMRERTPENAVVYDAASERLLAAAALLEGHLPRPGRADRRDVDRVKRSLREAIALLCEHGLTLVQAFKLENVESHVGGCRSKNGCADPLLGVLMRWDAGLSYHFWADVYIVLSKTLLISPQEVKALAAGLGDGMKPDDSETLLLDWYKVGRQFYLEEVAPFLAPPDA
jgi:hypothetical protein